MKTIVIYLRIIFNFIKKNGNVMGWTHMVVGLVVGLGCRLDFGQLAYSLAECVLTETD